MQHIIDQLEEQKRVLEVESVELAAKMAEMRELSRKGLLMEEKKLSLEHAINQLKNFMDHDAHMSGPAVEDTWGGLPS